jgi:hypothetical protein
MRKGATLIRIIKKRLTRRFAVMLIGVVAFQNQQASTQRGSESSPLEVVLSSLGYRSLPECRYKGSGIPRDLTILNDDYKKRIVFIDDHILVIYQSHCFPAKKGSPDTRSMEAFFVNSHTGRLISKKTWETVKRRWVNERWDTQARILAVADGFVVHAGQSLTVYSPGFDKKAELKLDGNPQWAATVAPQGRTIHLQRIEEDNKAKGKWLAADTLTELRSQEEMAGAVSASDMGVVYKLAHCLKLQAIGEASRNLYCADSSHLGLPLVLTDSEVLSFYYKGFGLWSFQGERLWGREVTKGAALGGQKRSLQGNRFAFLL